MNIENLVAKTLADLGVHTIFGVMGDVNMYMVERFVAGGGDYVGAFNEAGATQMAMGYASITGRIGVATATCGPGFTNTLTSLIEGEKAHHAIVVLTGQARDDRRGFMQTVDQRALTLATGAGFERPDDARDLQASLVRAFQRAHAELRPIVYELPPYNLHTTIDAPYKAVSLDLRRPKTALEAGEAWDNAIGIIATAKRPIILAGYGAVLEDAKDALLQLSQRIGAPIATTLRAKDYVRGSAADLGLMGLSCRAEAVDALLASDCIIGFGASLNTYTTSNGTYLNGKRVVAFNNLAFDTDKYAIPDVAIQVNLKAAVEYVIQGLDNAEIERSGFIDEDVVIKARKAIQQRRTLQKAEFNAPGFLSYDKAMRVIDETVGQRILVTESGRYKYSAWHNVSVDDPRRFIPSISYGAIGVGLGHAIGAAVADPNATVILAVGDGGMMNAGLSELKTIQNRKLKVLVVVCDDRAYGTEYQKFAERGVDPDFTRLEQPDFAKVATALGGTGIRIESVDDLPRLKTAIEQWPGDGLLLVDLVVDTRSAE
jgi:thiamine pyrophosphate-dependent acetolactate synthase large subunit-like protein